MDAKDKVRKFLATHHLTEGLGTEDAPCSMAAINLVLTGRLTDEIPECCSEVVGNWIIITQDKMPFSLRNSRQWKNALVGYVGSGREKEIERTALIVDWAWAYLEGLTPLAQALGLEERWTKMCLERKTEVSKAALWNVPNPYYSPDFYSLQRGARLSASITKDTRSSCFQQALDAAWIVAGDPDRLVAGDPAGLLEKLNNL
jgi:hypothetical protein